MNEIERLREAHDAIRKRKFPLDQEELDMIVNLSSFLVNYTKARQKIALSAQQQTGE